MSGYIFSIVGTIWLALVAGTLFVVWGTDVDGKGLTWGQVLLSPLWAPLAGLAYLISFGALVAMWIAACAFDCIDGALPMSVGTKTEPVMPWWKRTAIRPRMRSTRTVDRDAVPEPRKAHLTDHETIKAVTEIQVADSATDSRAQLQQPSRYLTLLFGLLSPRAIARLRRHLSI